MCQLKQLKQSLSFLFFSVFVVEGLLGHDQERVFYPSSSSYTVDFSLRGLKASECVSLCENVFFMRICFSAQDSEVKCVKLLPGCWAVVSD